VGFNKVEGPTPNGDILSSVSQQVGSDPFLGSLALTFGSPKPVF